MTKAEFLEKRATCLQHEVKDWLEVRDFLLNATHREKPESHFYRYLREPDPEADIRLWLEEFARSDLAPHDLLLLRRFALRRYAFRLAAEISHKMPEGERSAVWLKKDFILPRVGLSLLVGYGVLLGAGEALTWLYHISRHWVTWLLLPILLVCSFLLVYLNVRDHVGRAANVGCRTVCAWCGCICWAIFLVLSSALLSVPARAHFEWPHAALCGAFA